MVRLVLGSECLVNRNWVGLGRANIVVNHTVKILLLFFFGGLNTIFNLLKVLNQSLKSLLLEGQDLTLIDFSLLCPEKSCNVQQQFPVFGVQNDCFYLTSSFRLWGHMYYYRMSLSFTVTEKTFFPRSTLQD